MSKLLHRSAARLAAVQALYQMEIAGTPLPDVLDLDLRRLQPRHGAGHQLVGNRALKPGFHKQHARARKGRLLRRAKLMQLGHRSTQMGGALAVTSLSAPLQAAHDNAQPDRLRG